MSGVLEFAVAGQGDQRVSATNPLPVASVDAPDSFVGFQQIENATLANSTALTVPATAQRASIQNKGTQPAVYRVDGSTNAPTATNGTTIPAGATAIVNYGNAALNTLRIIRAADGVTLAIEYSR